MVSATIGRSGDAPTAASGTSATLLDGVRAADPAAWDRFVRLYGPLLHDWCRQRGLQPSDADDVAQEVFRSVARDVGRFRPDGSPQAFRRWLKAVTGSRVADRRRRDRRQPVGAGGPDPSDPDLDPTLVAADDPVDAAVARDEARQLTRRAVELVLESCDPVTRRAFLRVYADGERTAAVAASLGLTCNAIYAAAARIKQRLRAEFAGLVELSDGP